MNSLIKPAKTPTNWILTTCRGRVAHLRESLPTWLERLPNWSPLVVCCDDPEATAYAAGELRLAGRGAVVSTTQGAWFSRLEAIRVGLHALACCGIESDGGAYEVQLPPDDANPEPILAGRIAIFDADTIALARTGPVIDEIDPYAVGIVRGGNRDDLGFLVTGAAVLQYAVAQVERDAFKGYGYEDSAIRVGCWHATAGAFVTVPPCWSRKTHTDAERIAHYEEPARASSTKNAKALGRLITHLIDRDSWKACCDACIPSQKFEIHLGEP